MYITNGSRFDNGGAPHNTFEVVYFLYMFMVFTGLFLIHESDHRLLLCSSHPMGYVDVFRRGRAAVPSHSWSVFGPKANLRSVYSMEIPHLNLVRLTHYKNLIGKLE
ncbi:hypothetical protein JG688_00013833 [Phytophthora aleatoria]|uniref:Uncharacterized protein n=1 Tax=Phytophthora aleatoria TaxID=2496075 RepID=A0A8J5ILJ2_9STRA|nr:hypothetical protein JG688_00013833 [Phytophthora aleatoria]